MIVVMEAGVSEEIIDQVIKRLREFGFDVHLSKGVERTVIGAIGEKTAEKIQQLEATPGVQKIVPILQPYKLAREGIQARAEQDRGARRRLWRRRRSRSSPVRVRWRAGSRSSRRRGW